GLHLFDAAADEMFLQLEIRNPVHQQAADPVSAFVERYVMARARQLLRARKARRAGTDHGDALAGLARGRQRRDPALGPGVVDDIFFEQFDGDRIVVDVEDTGLFARRRAYAAGELREIVGRMQALDGFLPAPAIHQVVPVRDDVAERTALVAERDAAIHASRPLRAKLVLGQLEIILAPILQALGDRTPRRRLALDLHESGYFAHLVTAAMRRRSSGRLELLKFLRAAAMGSAGYIRFYRRPRFLHRGQARHIVACAKMLALEHRAILGGQHPHELARVAVPSGENPLGQDALRVLIMAHDQCVHAL